MVPTRFVHGEQARRRHGDKVDRLAAQLWERDPLADEASLALSRLPAGEREPSLRRALGGPGGREGIPDALGALVAQAERTPFWVDRRRVERGASVFVRMGVWAGIALGYRSLVMGYCSPAGNKPLALSGRLKEAAPRRLAETARYVQAVTTAGGLVPFAPGFQITLRVRLMHAQVRRLLSASERWDRSAWGTPINQADMAGTLLLFSLSVVDGVRRCGLPVSDTEAEDLLHLWRYAGFLMGVREELLCATLQEARDLWEIIESTQGDPDADSGALSRALIEGSALGSVEAAYGLSRFLIGDRLADALGYPKTLWRFAPGAARPWVRAGAKVLRRLPFGDRLMHEGGRVYWRRVLQRGLGGVDATFQAPDSITGTGRQRRRS